jgi:hypothetical protein
MTLEALIAALRERGAGLVVDGDRLRYLGPRLAADHPIRSAIAEQQLMLVELFAYTPGGRCIEDGCYRLRADGAETRPVPHLVLDLLPNRVSLKAA